jgi:hypothetical protein
MIISAACTMHSAASPSTRLPSGEWSLQGVVKNDREGCSCISLLETLTSCMLAHMQVALGYSVLCAATDDGSLSTHSTGVNAVCGKTFDSLLIPASAPSSAPQQMVASVSDSRPSMLSLDP